MKKTIQRQMLSYMLQYREALPHIEYYTPDFFDDYISGTLFNHYKQFVSIFKYVPTQLVLWKYIKDNEESKDELKAIKKLLKNKVYVPVPDLPYIQKNVIDIAKDKAVMNMIGKILNDKDSSDTITGEYIDLIQRSITKIARIGIDLGFLREETRLFADYNKHKNEWVAGHPTYLKGLNHLTSAHGFLSPELVVMFGAPKGFKTGTSLNIAIEYAKAGYNVYYADCENGMHQLTNRSHQQILKTDYVSLIKDKSKKKKLNQIMKRIGGLGGELIIGYYPAKISTLDDVDEALQRWKADENWEPQIIFYDYLDLFRSTDKKLDKRLGIQDVYHHAIRLNVKWGTFSFTPSHVRKEAVNKLVIEMTDAAEDFGKAANAHAGFAICRTPLELFAGLARLVPVFQRMGKRYSLSACVHLKIIEERMEVFEISKEKYNKIIEKNEADYKQSIQQEKKNYKIKIDIDKLNDQ